MGCARPLMDEIERRFAGADLSECPDIDVARVHAKDHVTTPAHASDLASAKMLEDKGRLGHRLIKAHPNTD